MVCALLSHGHHMTFLYDIEKAVYTRGFPVFFLFMEFPDYELDSSERVQKRIAYWNKQ